MAGFTAEQVEEVRMVIRMLPVFLTTILYWTIYAQVPLRCVHARPHRRHMRHDQCDACMMSYDGMSGCRQILLVHSLRSV